MTGRKFLKRIIFLMEQMCILYSAEPLDQEARRAILDEVHKLGQRFNRSRRLRHAFWVIVHWICFGVFVGLMIRKFYLP